MKARPVHREVPADRIIRLPPAPAGLRLQRPWVLVNMAMSADGKIATADRAIHTFGSPRDLAHLYELRAMADAVMCGARTVALDATLGPGGSLHAAVTDNGCVPAAVTIHETDCVGVSENSLMSEPRPQAKSCSTRSTARRALKMPCPIR